MTRVMTKMNPGAITTLVDCWLMDSKDTYFSPLLWPGRWPCLCRMLQCSLHFPSKGKLCVLTLILQDSVQLWWDSSGRSRRCQGLDNETVQQYAHAYVWYVIRQVFLWTILAWILHLCGYKLVSRLGARNHLGFSGTSLFVPPRKLLYIASAQYLLFL